MTQYILQYNRENSNIQIGTKYIASHFIPSYDTFTIGIIFTAVVLNTVKLFINSFITTDININSIGISTTEINVDNKNDITASVIDAKNKYNNDKKESNDNLKYGNLIKGIILIINISYTFRVNKTIMLDNNFAKHNFVLEV